MKGKRKSKKSELWGYKHLVGLCVLAGAVFGAIFYFALQAKPVKSEVPTTGPVPTYFQTAKSAMPFPATLEPGSFKQTEVREAYRTAKEIPEVLAQQPCYCYCQRKGHRSLLDCFRTDHAASCTICIREALLAAQMRRQQKSAQEIWRAIIHGSWAGERSSNQ